MHISRTETLGTTGTFSAHCSPFSGAPSCIILLSFPFAPSKICRSSVYLFLQFFPSLLSVAEIIRHGIRRRTKVKSSRKQVGTVADSESIDDGWRLLNFNVTRNFFYGAQMPGARKQSMRLRYRLMLAIYRPWKINEDRIACRCVTWAAVCSCE